MASGSVFSETLQSITTAKLSELSNKRATFEARHSSTINRLADQSDPLARVTTLLEGVKHCFGIETKGKADNIGGKHDGLLEGDLDRLDRFLEQAKFDPSISARILEEWEDTLLRYLSVQLRRYQYATLYGQLVTEWLSPETRAAEATGAPSTDVEMGESFEELPGRKRLEAREQFEQSVFTPADVDEAAIKRYLQTLFSDEESSGTKTTSKALTTLRESATKFEAQLSIQDQFSTSTVSRSIGALLKGDLFAGEKRTVLKNFQSNNIILSEIADVLNMRMSALDTWSWGSGGVPIEQRRKLNGRFNIFMHEDLLQAIFLQFLGTEWSVFFKTALKRFRRDAWKSNFRQMSRIENKRREYYLGQQEMDDVLARKRRRTYRKGYFIYQLLDSAEQEIEQNEGEEEATFEAEFIDYSEEDEEAAEESAAYAGGVQAYSMKRKAPGRGSARKGLGTGGAKRHRKIITPQLDDGESDDGSEEMYSVKKPMEKRQDLLHLLSTEAAVNQRVNGSFAAFRSVFDELQNSLPHQAVMLVLSFFGVSEKWQGFFRRYLEAPLRFLEDDGNADADPRERKRGAPASHTLSDVFSETMLFCVDYSINRCGDGAFLYRLADDFWFWSHDQTKAGTTWKEIQKFAGTMGLPINEGKSGSISIPKGNAKGELPTGRIRWGMMYFDPQTLRFKIDQKMVDEHIEELKKQLAAKSSVFDWIQVWNAYANTFFASNFGRAANCFGQQHVDDILTTHQRIQKTIFGGQNVVQYLKSIIEQRFGMKDLADGFLFFPVELGGLELQSPFVSPLQIRDSVAKTPSKVLDEFETNEKDQYQHLKTMFDKGRISDSRDQVDDPHWKPAEGADEFMSFEEYTKYREELKTTYEENFLLLAYDELLEKPAERSLELSPAVKEALERLRNHAHARGITGYWATMDAYWKWIAQLHGPEMIERFGGMSVVESGLLPIGMVGLFRDQKVKWQG